MNFCLGRPRGVKNIIIQSIPAKKVIIVVPGIVGITKNEITGKTSINKLTYLLTKLRPGYLTIS
jgi:hypothetical protein